jgi:hypothetical protein
MVFRIIIGHDGWDLQVEARAAGADRWGAEQGLTT